MSPTSYQTAPPRVSFASHPFGSGGSYSPKNTGRSTGIPSLLDVPQRPQPPLGLPRRVRRPLPLVLVQPGGEGVPQMGVGPALGGQDVPRLPRIGLEVEQRRRLPAEILDQLEAAVRDAPQLSHQAVLKLVLRLPLDLPAQAPPVEAVLLRAGSQVVEDRGDQVEILDRPGDGLPP